MEFEPFRQRAQIASIPTFHCTRLAADIRGGKRTEKIGIYFRSREPQSASMKTDCIRYRRVCPMGERAYSLLEKASGDGPLARHLKQALDIIIGCQSARERLPKMYRDALIMALARVKTALLDGADIMFVEDYYFYAAFEGATAVVEFWSERPEETARRSAEYVQEMRALADYLHHYAQCKSASDRETARVIREYESRERKGRSSRVA